MFPLRDTVRSKSIPIVNLTLIIINIIIFFLGTTANASSYASLMGTFALVPARLSLAQPFSFLTLLSSTFLHGSWFHLISNMWILFIFGDNVEDRMGKGRYLFFFLAAGVAAGLIQSLLVRDPSIPTVGASGAIAGVLGAYFVLYPRARILTFIPIFIVPWFTEISAMVFLGIWFLIQLFSGVISAGSAGVGMVAWWAHIGGFIFGFILVRVFVPRGRQHN
jgi:membrane associated rhomboid family serine protease